MKGVFVVLDGLGDQPHKLLEDMTPLEAAETPNLDFFAARGEMGFLYTVKPGFAPGTNEALSCIFGNQLKDSSRGPIEAKGADVEIKRGDLCLRTNFATIDSLEK